MTSANLSLEDQRQGMTVLVYHLKFQHVLCLCLNGHQLTQTMEDRLYFTKM